MIQQELSDVVYAKLNSTRKQEFCISTIIEGDKAGYAANGYRLSGGLPFF